MYKWINGVWGGILISLNLAVAKSVSLSLSKMNDAGMRINESSERRVAGNEFGLSIRRRPM